MYIVTNYGLFPCSYDAKVAVFVLSFVLGFFGDLFGVFFVGGGGWGVHDHVFKGSVGIGGFPLSRNQPMIFAPRRYCISCFVPRIYCVFVLCGFVPQRFSYGVSVCHKDDDMAFPFPTLAS